VTVAAAVALASGLALVARTVGWLTTGGAVAAAAVGAVIFTGAGIPGATLLALFFVSGSLLTYAGGGAARLDPGERGGRTARQVVSNGGWAAAGALALWLEWQVGWPIVVGSLAAAQADTWATEIGMRSRTAPRLITDGRQVAAGTSGGITARGTAGGVLGAAAAGGVALLTGAPLQAAGAGLVGGVVGMLGDSLLGATAQAIYHCDSCVAQTERAVHRCGTHARRVRGLPWLGNNAVNFAATGLGSAAAVAAWVLS
jgi:uncharacterized protein (TIGR00297 family)